MTPFPFETEVKYNSEKQQHECHIILDEKSIYFAVGDHLLENKELLFDLLLRRGLQTAIEFNLTKEIQDEPTNETT